MARGERGVGDLNRDRAGRFDGEVAPAGVANLVLGVAVRSGRDRADAGVRPVGIDRQQQPLPAPAGPRAPVLPSPNPALYRLPSSGLTAL